jgi:hypothetical protein
LCSPPAPDHLPIVSTRCSSGSEDEAEQEEEQQQEEEGAHPNEVPRPAPVKWARAHLSTSVRSGPPLVCTLRAMYGEDPQVGAFYDAWMESAWRWKSCKRGITGLLDVVTSGEGGNQGVRRLGGLRAGCGG